MDKESNFSIDPKALFLGPYSENQDEFRKLIDFLINDIVQWRRNYHPQKPRLIQANYKEKENWKKTFNNLNNELDILLGEMKQSIPFHNPRFIGHMHSDLALPALLGYLAGQLYNQNNVVGESSPVTTEKELQFIKYLCEMFHYPPFEHPFKLDQKNKKRIGVKKQNKIVSTGHLTSGGTTANIEALWTARNVKYFPISLKLLLHSKKENPSEEWKSVLEIINKIEVNCKGEKKEFSKISVKNLFNLSPEMVLSFHSDLKRSLNGIIREKGKVNSSSNLIKTEFEPALKKHTVRVLGVHGIHKAIEKKFKVDIDVPCLVVPQSRHYSWEKAMDILGLGSKHIKYVQVDEEFKINANDFERVCKDLSSVLMAVGVVGTTEEGVIDPITDIIKIKMKLERKGAGFWVHIDAAYGGYYAALFNNSERKGSFYNLKELKENNTKIKNWLNSYLLNDFKAIKESDSITIDPHKMGYVPYAAGAVLYKNNRTKPFIEKKAPYLASGDGSEYDSTKIYLGGSTLEGSRSGAAALACYLTSKVISNDSNGYGRLLLATFKNARVFIDKMYKHNIEGVDNDLIQIQVHPLYDSLTNIVCYAVGIKDINLSAKELNRLNTLLYKEMSAEKNKTLNDYKFIVSQTELDYESSPHNPGYKNQIDAFLKKFKIPKKEKEKGYKLVLLRSALMNPMLTNDDREEIFSEYFRYLQQLVNKILPEVLLESILERQEYRRFKVLWIENQERVENLKRAILKGGRKQDLDISRFLDIKFISNLTDDDLKNLEKDYQIFIVDLNLNDGLHTEWRSGLSVLKKIKERYSDSLILIYSQFLNPKFKLVSERKSKSTIDINYSIVIGNFLKTYLGLSDNNLILKAIDADGTKSSEDKPIELKDFNLLSTKLAKVVFNEIGKNGK